MEELTDIELVDLARKDSDEAKVELFNRSKNTISYSIRRYTGSFWKQLGKDEVEDLTSECYIAVMKAIAMYDASKGASFTHFLKFRIRKQLYDLVGAKIEESKIVVSETTIDLRKMKAPDSLESLKRELTIKVKNERDRKIIDLFLEGMRQTDIADEFKITKGRVQQIIKECIK